MKKLVNFRLALFLAVALCLGIVCAYFCNCEKAILSVAIAVAFISCVFVYLFLFTDKNARRKSIVFSIVFIIIFLFGSGIFTIKTEHYRNADLGNHYYNIKGKICDVNDTDYGMKFILNDVYVDGDVSGKLYYKVEVYVYDKTDYRLGDYIAINGYLIDKPIFYDGRFSAYSIAGGIKYSVTSAVNDISFIKSSPNIFQKTNLLIKDNLRAGLSDDSFAVAYALLTGNSDYIDIDTLTSYRQAGIAHIFAVSGLHIGFLASIISFILKKLKIRGLLKAVIITLALFFYSGVCNFTASSVRAAVMCAVLSFITAKGQKYDGITGLSIACILILVFSPFQLLCAGFELSFIVVLGILILAKPISRLLKFLPRKFADALGTVISAQIFGAPACIILFGETSLVAIILNLIFIPIVNVIFTITLIATLFCVIFGQNYYVFYVIDYCFKGINFLITFFDYDKFTFGGIALCGAVILHYLSAIVAGGFVNLKGKLRALTCVMLCSVFVISTVIYNIDVNNRSYVTFCGTQDVCFTLIDTPYKTVAVISDVNGFFSTSRLKRMSINNRIDKIDTLVFSEDAGKDLMAVVANLRTVFKLDEVVYYGQADHQLETVFLKSFPEYYIDSFSVGENIIESSGLTVNYSLNGKVVDAVVNGKKVGMFSKIITDDVKDYSVGSGYYLAVYSADGDIINNLLKPKNALSFRAGGRLKDAEGQGNVRLLIR